MYDYFKKHNIDINICTLFHLAKLNSFENCVNLHFSVPASHFGVLFHLYIKIMSNAYILTFQVIVLN
jgi:hypothetical protein